MRAMSGDWGGQLLISTIVFLFITWGNSDINLNVLDNCFDERVFLSNNAEIRW